MRMSGEVVRGMIFPTVAVITNLYTGFYTLLEHNFNFNINHLNITQLIFCAMSLAADIILILSFRRKPNRKKLVDLVVNLRRGHERSISRPPGSFLVTAARLVYSRRTYTTVFEPNISDMRIEYFEALAENHRGQARWIEIRGHLIFVAMLAHATASCGKVVSKIWKVIP
jgi:hypothetical protein